MSTVLATPISQIELSPDSAIRISGVSWEGYIALLQELGNDRSTRIAYDDGVLEIRMPGQPHEAANRVLAAIAFALAEELGVDFNNMGSTAFFMLVRHSNSNERTSSLSRSMTPGRKLHQ
ncbi:Uma2 family endonuclease [Leptolyngbya sp. 'hensonii']|uniref:Uma2 family endonuclease n=1 Tax=Leptolyngbya sp. 'hensonii' TaxID=1922337 RepID=UPI001C0D0B0C|nr:Uma2 family endonuclease [Leptolyngbya sp. 'hensonii']